jgi:hypothetical protein
LLPGGLAAHRSDLLALEPGSGRWTLYFRGRNVGLTEASENLNGAWLDRSSGHLYLTTAGDYDVTGAAGTGADIFTCAPAAPGANSACSFSPYRHNAAMNLAGRVINGLAIFR